MSGFRKAPCPIFRQCGGCDEMRQSEADQLEGKKQSIEQRMRRDLNAVYASPRSLNYRARINLRVTEAGQLCYYRPRTHQEVPVDTCTIARDEINVVIQALPSIPRGVENVEFRSNGSAVIVVLHTKRKAARYVEKQTREWPWQKMGIHGLYVNVHHVLGIRKTVMEVMGVKHQLGPKTFYQVNLEVNQLLALEVARIAESYAPTAILDLFSGAGNLSLPLAKKGRTITLMEMSPDALVDANATAKRMNVEIDARQVDASRYRAGDAFFDVAILDPARAGAAGVMQELAITRPRAMIYVACNPMAFQRDAREVERHGYHLKELSLFDMFPQTSHSELVGVFELN
jgi:23S rRNA (uracil1939-C5)-methyltransferase